MNKELLGATIITISDDEFTFAFDPNNEYTPYLQIDLNTYEVIDQYPIEVFEEIKLGYELVVGGKVTMLIAK